MFRLIFSLLITALAYSPPSALAQGAVEARHGMVVAQEARAARVGVEVLQNGGNAVDAAVATGFALAVTYPRAGNIGGGGYMVIHLADVSAGRGGQVWGGAIAIDYRETAPAATTRDVFLDSKGDADPAKSRESALSIGVPGTVAGLALAHAKYGSGKFTLAELIAPAIALARDGIPVDDDVADSLPRAQPRLARWPSSAKIFLKPDGSVLAPGDMLIQRDLADTLAAIARDGPRAFYEGPIAEHRRRRAVGRRAHDRARSRGLCADRARAGARQLSRPRDHLDAAVVVGRRDPDRDAQHPGRLPGPRRPTTPRGRT